MDIEPSVIEKLRSSHRLLSKAELASILTLTMHRLETAIKKGEVPPGRVVAGKHPKWSPTEVADHIEKKLASDDPLLMTSATAKFVGVHAATLRAWIRRGNFLEPDQMDRHKPMWRRSRVQAWKDNEAGGFDVGS